MRPAHRIPLALPLALLLAACSGSSPPADTPATDSADAAGQPSVPAGTPVYVNRGGQWLPATVVRLTGPATVLIHYEGTPAEYDEDVPFDRVRSRPDAAAPATFAAGDPVLVTAQNRVFLAEVVQPPQGGAVRIHYAGFGPEAVDNVPPERLKKPFTGATAFPAGSAVTVDAGGPQPLPGKVIAVIAADQWLVRLDNAGPQYDQQVGPGRIFGPGAPPPAATAPTATAPAATVSAPPAGTAAPAAGTAAPAAGTGAPAAGKAPPPATPAAPAAPALKVGDAVLFKVKTVYYPAKIVGAGAAAGSFKVRAEGQSTDEEAPAASLAPLQEPLKGVKYRVGQEVFVEWHGVYLPGKVVKELDTGNYRIKVDGQDEQFNIKKMRPR